MTGSRSAHVALVVAAASCAPFVAMARAETPENALTLEPLAVVFARTIALEYERGFGPVGLALGAAVGLGDVSHQSSGRSGDFTALGLTLSVRIYPWDLAPRGAFFGPFGSLGWVEAEAGDRRASGLGWSVGALAGYTWILGTSFILSGGAGFAWYEHEVGDGESGLFPTLRLAVGAAF